MRYGIVNGIYGTKEIKRQGQERTGINRRQVQTIDPSPQENPLVIVGIGASAGGLEALEGFFFTYVCS